MEGKEFRSPKVLLSHGMWRSWNYSIDPARAAQLGHPVLKESDRLERETRVETSPFAHLAVAAIAPALMLGVILAIAASLTQT